MSLNSSSSSIEADLSAQHLKFGENEKYFWPTLSYRTFGKRLLDVVMVLASAPIVAPVILAMALIVSLDGRSPFYIQERVGQNGKRFRIIKIRTMVHNAEAILEKHLESDVALRAEWAATQKLKNDVRVTPVGRILRATSLDELPQLINVLFGSMSLVGPRPMMPSQKELYSGKSYYRLRPGITGFWQVANRNHCDFRNRAKYDAAYDRKLSLWTDMGVLLRTVSVVLRGTGY